MKCGVQVVEHFQGQNAKGAKVKLGRWRSRASQDLTLEQAIDLARHLRTETGAVRVCCEAFEVVALRNSFSVLVYGAPK